MSRQKAKVSINKQGNQKGDGQWVIEIVDELSGIIVTRVSMSLAEFSECIGGLGCCEGEFEIIPTQSMVDNFGKVYESEYISIDLPEGVSKYSDKDKIRELVNESVPDGWELRSDGMRTQQNKPGVHTFIVYRYVKVDNETNS